jgi:hypothetical protein
MGFVVVSICFAACGIWYNELTTPSTYRYFQLLYYTSTFFGQWGPNATTWCVEPRCP